MSTHSKHTLKLTTLSASLRSMYILRNFIQKHSTAFKYDKDQVEFVIIVQKKNYATYLKFFGKGAFVLT